MSERVSCRRCDGYGSYLRVPDGFNPFLAGGFATARAAYRVQCFRCAGTGIVPQWRIDAERQASAPAPEASK